MSIEFSDGMEESVPCNVASYVQRILASLKFRLETLNSLNLMDAYINGCTVCDIHDYDVCVIWQQIRVGTMTASVET